MLTDEFRTALDLLENGRHLFLTGRAGTGKSTLVRHFMATTRRKVVVTAPTGIAALNVGGYTIHRLFSFLPTTTLDDIRTGRHYPARFRAVLAELETLVIDEASMLRADMFDMVVAALEKHGPIPGAPYGGVQLVLVGDLFQLPPVVTDAERGFFASRYATPYFFSADAYDASAMPTISLGHVFRQVGDSRLTTILNAMREGVLLEDARGELNSRTDPGFEPPPGEFWLTLAPTNRLVTARNRRALERLGTPLVTHYGLTTGDDSMFERPVEDVLQFKVGAQVMMVTNDPADRWANGTLGQVIDHRRDELGQPIVVVRLWTGRDAVVTPVMWEITRPAVAGGRLVHEQVGTFTQLPFKLAWAITIHKSQGQTLDRLVVDLAGGTFSYGQLYVALSRATSLSGLVLRRDVQARDLKVDHRVKRFLAAATAGPVRGYAYLGIIPVGDEGRMWKPRPLEIAVVTDRGESACTLVNPTRDLGAARVTLGIGAAEAQLAPLLPEAWPGLAPLLQGRIPVAVHVDQHLEHLDHELKRHGRVVAFPSGLDLPARLLGADDLAGLEASSALERAWHLKELHERLLRAEPEAMAAARADATPFAPVDAGQQHGGTGFFTERGATGLRFRLVGAATGDAHTRLGADGPATSPQEALAAHLSRVASRTSLGPAARTVLCGEEERLGHPILATPEESRARPDDLLQPGTRVCFTGTVVDASGRLLDRDEMHRRAEDAGLVPVRNVTRTRCDLLVVAEEGTQSGKARRAAQYGTPILAVEQFLDWEQRHRH